MTAIPDPTDAPCEVASQVIDYFHTIQHVLIELRHYGAEGSDAELIERHQTLIGTLVAMVGPQSAQYDPYQIHGTQ